MGILGCRSIIGHIGAGIDAIRSRDLHDTQYAQYETRHPASGCLEFRSVSPQTAPIGSRESRRLSRLAARACGIRRARVTRVRFTALAGSQSR